MQVLEAARQIHRLGLVVGTSGNVSLRLPTEGRRRLLAITPSQRDLDTITADDIPVIDFEMEPVEGDLPPSMETTLHIGVYRARRNVNAVVHSHPVYASAIAVTGRDIPPILEDQVAFLGGEIKLAPHAPSGSGAMVAAVSGALGERNAVLLANHGAVTVGRNMHEALTAAELLEKTARVYYLALSLGRVNLLPEAAQQAGLAYFRRLQERDGPSTSSC
jgi:ribulose-5-phosphate 4-epimerase/fuculose-1-phosphate aldolase